MSFERTRSRLFLREGGATDTFKELVAEEQARRADRENEECASKGGHPPKCKRPYAARRGART